VEHGVDHHKAEYFRAFRDRQPRAASARTSIGLSAKLAAVRRASAALTPAFAERWAARAPLINVTIRFTSESESRARSCKTNY
jgi:hypothetical protein